jgi:hypothetical protein
VVEGVGVDAMSLHFAFEVPHFAEWSALSRYHDGDDDLPEYEEGHGGFAENFEGACDG